MTLSLLVAVLEVAQLSQSGYRHLTPLRNTVTLSLTTDRASYYPGELITLKVEARNVGDSPMTCFLSFSTAKRGFTVLHRNPGSTFQPISGLVDPVAHWATPPQTLQAGDAVNALLPVAVTAPWNRTQVGDAILASVGPHAFKILYSDTPDDPNGLLESQVVTVDVVSPGGDDALAAQVFTPGLSYITQLDLGDGFLSLSLQAEAEAFLRRFHESRYAPPLKSRLKSWLEYRDRLGVTNGEEKARLARLSGDSVPPALGVQAAPTSLWPPDKKLVSVVVTVTASDNSGTAPAIKLVAITCNDACDPATDIAGAAIGTDDRAFSLRADRTGSGNGRTYTITYEASDAAGNKTIATTTVTVPHDQAKN